MLQEESGNLAFGDGSSTPQKHSVLKLKTKGTIALFNQFSESYGPGH